MPELEARLVMRDLESRLREYFSALDNALDVLSHGKEGLLTKVPAWCLAHREVSLGTNRDGRGVVVKIAPKETLEEDVYRFEELETLSQLRVLIRPWKADFEPSRLSHIDFALFGPMYMGYVNDSLAPPPLDQQDVIGYGNRTTAEGMFDIESGKKDAIELWNGALTGVSSNGSFISEAKAVFGRFATSIRLKAFRERRIHRLLRDHAGLLLPTHKRLFFEHELWLGQAMRKADFILERETGFPALLVELESPVHQVFRRDGNLTHEATHAKEQIAEWTSFIDRDVQRNAQGEMLFLAGPKQRLVVIGRGLEHRDLLLKQRWTDTSFWTYDLLLDEVRDRWNDTLAEQCRQVGRSLLRPF